MVKILSAFARTFTGALLVLGLVNCTKIGFVNSTSSSSVQKDNQGNGDNYDGKIFVHSDPANLCPDSSPKRSTIQLINKKYSLLRRDCVQVTPAQPLAADDIQIDPVYSGIISYKTQKYIFDASSLAAKTADLDCVKRNFGPADALKVYNVQGPKGAMLAGLLTAGGTVHNLVFASAAIDTSPAAKLSGSDQEGNAAFILSGFDPSAAGPDGTNTAYTLSLGTLGAEGFIYCARPSGTL